MIKRIYSLLTVFLISILLTSCNVENMFPRKGSVKMIVIGMDYNNSTGASDLSGTINDAREMAAAYKTLIDSKGIPFSLTWLVQEGYDIQIEVDITSVSSLDAVIEDILLYITTTECSSSEVYKSGEYDACVKAFVKNEEVANDIKQTLESRYPGSPALVSVKSMSLRDKPDYPSKENIIKTIKELKVSSDDLVFVYYTGHGALFDTIDEATLKSLLKKYSNIGIINNQIEQKILDLEMYTEELICSVVDDEGISGEDYISFRRDLRNIFQGSSIKEGALITAPTDKDPLYGRLKMTDLYDILSSIPCNVIVITDACYSGLMSEYTFSDISIKDSIISFMNNKLWPNIAALSASTKDETSKITVVRTNEGEYQRHSMFTIGVLEELEWIHTEKKYTYLQVPAYSITETGYETSSKTIAVPGYLRSIMARQTAEDFFCELMERWETKVQTPQTNNTVCNIYIIP